MAENSLPPVPTRRAPLIDIMRELEARPRSRRSQEFDPVAALAAERRSQSRQPLPLPPIPPAAPLPSQPGETQAGAGTPPPAPDLSGVYPDIRRRLPENNPYVAAAIRIAEKYDLPPSVFLSLVQRESNFNPTAVSPRGAVGLGQLMPGTAQELGVDPRDPEANLDASARYLKQQITRFGSIPIALAAYNAGPGRVAKSGNQVPNIRETQEYVSDIMRNAGMEGYEGDRRYGFAEGGLAALDQKYAEGGEVTELGQPFYQDDARYSFANDPAIDFPADTMRPLNIRNLIDLGAMRITYPGTGVSGGGANTNDEENFSVVSFYNDLLGGQSRDWPTHKKQNEFADMLQKMQQQAFYQGKYNQIVDSARRLGVRDEDIFMPEQQGEINGQRNGYADGGRVQRESLADMEDRYANAPTVRSADEEYDRRLLERDPLMTPASRLGVAGVPVPRGGRAMYPGNAVSPFEAAASLLPTMEGVQRGMMSAMAGVDIPEGARVVQTDMTRSGYAIETADGRLIDPEGRQGRDVREFAGTTRRSAVLPVSQDVETGERSLDVPAVLDMFPMAGVQGGPAGTLGAGRARRLARNYELPEVDFEPNPRAVIGANNPPTGRGVLMATGEARKGKPATGGLREAIPVPDVPGAAPDRSPGTVIRHNPAKGDSARFADFQSRIENEPSLLDEIMSTAREGEDIGRVWYNTEATRQRFVDALGEKAGHDAWAEFMYRMGGASPGNAVYPNIRQASYYYAESPEARAARQAEFKATGKYPRPPEPYGSLTQQYQAVLNDLIDRKNFLGNIEPTRAPKPRGFANSLMGNPENIAADKHFMRFIGMASGDPRFLHGSAVISQELASEIADRFPEIARENIKTREVKDATGKKVMQTSFNAARAVRDNGGANGELFEFIRNRPTVWDEVPRDNEYGAYERLALDIANRMNMTPAQLQASLWMGAARRTGVRESSLDTFDNIFNRVIQDRAAERGLDPAEVFRLFVNRMQPLAIPGAVGAGAAIEGAQE